MCNLNFGIDYSGNFFYSDPSESFKTIARGIVMAFTDIILTSRYTLVSDHLYLSSFRGCVRDESTLLYYMVT